MSIRELDGATRFHRQFLWRLTGLPCETLDQFALDPLADTVMGAVKAIDQSPTADTSVLGRPTRGYEASFESAFLDIRRRLAVLASMPIFQSAVAYSSPDAAGLLSRMPEDPSGVRRSDDKRRELLAMRYLQRFVMKCETASSVGPVVTGSLTNARSSVEFRHDPTSYTPTTFIGQSFLRRLIQRFRQFPGIMSTILVRRRSGVWPMSEGLAIHPHSGVLRVGELGTLILQTAKRPQAVKDLEPAGLEPETLLQVVYALLEMGLLTDELADAYHADDPLALIDSILGRPGVSAPRELGDLLSELERGQSVWANSDAAERLHVLRDIQSATSAAGIVWDNAGARFYGDHLPFVEDGLCARSFITLDTKWAKPFLGGVESAILSLLARSRIHRSAVRRSVAQQIKARASARCRCQSSSQKLPSG